MTSAMESQDQKAIKEALWGYDQDANKAAYIDNILNSTIGTIPIDKFKEEWLRTLIVYRHYGQAIQSQQFDQAIKWAKSIGEKTVRERLLLKTAGYASSNLDTLDMARDALSSIENSVLQSTFLVELCMAQIVRGNLHQAKELTSQVNKSTLHENWSPVIDFVLQHYGESIDHLKILAEDPARFYRVRMALIYAIHKDVAGMAEFLGYNKHFTSKQEEGQHYAVIIGFYAGVLGLSGLYDQALALLNEIHDPKFRLIQLAYLTTHVPFPETTLNSIYLQLGNTPMEAGIGDLIFEYAFSNQMAKAIQLLRKIKYLAVRDEVFSLIEQYTYQLLEISRGNEPKPFSYTQVKSLPSSVYIAGVLFLLLGIFNVRASFISFIEKSNSTISTSILAGILIGISGLFMILSGVTWFLKKRWAFLIGGVGCFLFSVYLFLLMSIESSGILGPGCFAALFFIVSIVLIILFFVGRKKQKVL